MDASRKYIVDRFQELLYQNYEAYCERHGIDKTDEHRLITFMIDQGLVSASHIQRYTVLKEFEKTFPEQAYHKTQTVTTLADRFSISERTVWSILKHIKQIKKV